MSKALVYYQNGQFYKESMFDTAFIRCETMSGNSWEILEEPTIVEIFQISQTTFQNNFLMTQGKQSKKLLGINKNIFIVDAYGILHTPIQIPDEKISRQIFEYHHCVPKVIGNFCLPEVVIFYTTVKRGKVNNLTVQMGPFYARNF